MSAFSVGSQVATKTDEGKQAAEPTSSVPAAFVKWIPGEAITFYAAILGIGATQGDVTGDETPQQLLERIDAGSPGWFIVGAAIAALLVITGALATKPPEGSTGRSFGSLALRTVLALISFVIWTTALPGAWPYGWHLVRDLGAAYGILLVPIAALFATIAELATRRWTL